MNTQIIIFDNPYNIRNYNYNYNPSANSPNYKNNRV